ncbi:hypothetical protein CDES_09265 [Corynebacterium deserti GIMN1.010]|uniref:Uncharacterized protein n=1 Tax=Corynebacterium deserti GIMN1.010 TaxID=931089 RepID=A0A0M4CYN5_9CORY|nr:hypothetical protein CDES_09265 [Corynebacterium deserti GIMN1.010]
MRGQEDNAPIFGPQRIDGFPHFASRPGVKSSSVFVKDQNFWIIQQRADFQVFLGS